MKRWLFLVVCVSLLSGCAGYVRSHISVFHEIPLTFTGATYSMILLKEQEGSLEHKAYEQAIKRELDTRGFREVPIDNAEIAVFFSYGTDTGKEVVRVMGSTVITHPEYTRFLKLVFVDKRVMTENQIKKIYEATVISRGTSGQLPEVVPTMIKSLFEDFPGKSGSTRYSKRAKDE